MKIKFYLLMLPLLCATLANAAIVWDGNSLPWTAGSGTEADPYLIEAPQHLAWLSDMLTAQKSHYEGVWFKQTEDFDMNASNYNWVRIGSESYTFQGNYDGDSHLITNITDGVFGFVEKSIFKKLSVSNVLVKNCSNSDWGPMIANAKYATISQCYFHGNLTFSGSYNNNIGGLIGSITHCTINQCGTEGDFKQTYDPKSSSYFLYIGGLFGSAFRSKLIECYHRGEVSSAQNYVAIGGLIGYYGSDTLTYCYVQGDVAASSSYSSGNRYAGGLMGRSDQAGSCIVSNCYCASLIKGGVRKNFSPLCPNDSYTTVINSYYSQDGISSSAGTLRDDNQMKSSAFPVMLNGDRDDLFIMDKYGVNGGYPIFAWQEPENESIVTISTLCAAKAGTVSGAGEYLMGKTVVLSAIANPGYEFKCWSDGNTDNPRLITVDANATYTAIFYKTAFDIHIYQNCTSTVE